MQNKIIEKLRNYKNIAILGFGKEGLSTYNFIRKYDKELLLTILDKRQIDIDDENAKYKPYNSEDDLAEFDLVIKTPGIPAVNFSLDTKAKITSQMELLLELEKSS